MKITALSVNNIGDVEHAKLAFTKSIALLLGLNGQGKTTLCRAVELVLRGDIFAFTGRAAPIASLIGGADQTALVGATIERAAAKPVAIERALSPRGVTTSVDGQTATKAVFDYFSPNGMRDPEGVWRVVCNATAALELESAALKDLLSSLIDQGVPAAMLEGLPLAGHIKGVPSTIDGILAAHDVVFEKRKLAKKDLAGIRIPKKPDEEPVSKEDLGEIDAAIAGLETNVEALIASQGEARGLRTAAEQRLARAETAVAAKSKARVDLGHQDDAEKASEAAQAAFEDAERRAAAPAPVAGRRGILLNEQTLLLGIKANLSKFIEATKAKDCPHCGTSVEPVGARRTLERIEKRLPDLAKELEKNPAPAAVATINVASFRQARDTAAKKLLDIAEADRALAAAETEQQAATGELAATAAVADPPALATLRERIATGRTNKAEAEKINADHAAHLTESAKHKKTAKTVEELEALCEAFGPKGIAEKLLTERVGAMQMTLNGLMKTFGLALTFRTDPWGVRVNGRPIVSLSASERFRAGVAFQLALAETTSARFAMIDGADILDGENRAILFELLETAVAKGWVDQAIVTATTQADLLADDATETRAAVAASFADRPIEPFWVAGGKVAVLVS